MVDLNVNSNILTLSCFSHTIVLTSSGGSYEDRMLNNHDKPTTEKTTDDGGIPLVTCEFSRCGTMFACCSQKTLSLWNVKDWKLLSRKNINRSVSKIIFSPKADRLIICDKTGDVYLQPIDDFETPALLILGHVSVLLDVLITNDEKYIITCDRDEKIRVSHYPNGYNIESFCLGHEECVTSLNILPHDPSVLVSSSGDGTIRFWDYVKGKEMLIHIVSINEVSKTESDESVKKRDIILKTCTAKLETDVSLLCSLIIPSNGITIHTVHIFNSTIKCELKQWINLSMEPLCLTITNDNRLVVLQSHKKEPILICHYSNKKFEIKNEDLNINEYITKYFDLLNTQFLFVKEKYVNSLYKKKFDNESLYLKRKFERIESLKDKKQCSEINE